MKKRALAIFLAILIPSVAFAAYTAGDAAPCGPCCDSCPFK